MQLAAVKGRLFDGSKAAITARWRHGGSELPVVLAAVEVFVYAGFHEAVEAANRSLEFAALDPKFCRQFRQRAGARHRARYFGPDRPVCERILLQILRVENEIGGQIGIFMPPRVEQTKLRHDPLEECLVGKAPAISVHQQRMWTAQLDDPGIDAG